MFLDDKTTLVPKVKDIEQFLRQPRNLQTVKENATVEEAARIMSKKHIGSLIVYSMDDRFAGVLTERDILSKVTTANIPPQYVLVSQIMTANAITCQPDTPVEKIRQLMAEHKIRHVPILEEGFPVSMISSRDIIAYELHSSRVMKNAAEELAMLSTELKNLNLKEVVSLAINEIPRTFSAKRAVLCLPQSISEHWKIYRKDCPLSRLNLLDNKKMQLVKGRKKINFDDVCSECQQIGGQSPRLLIPLNTKPQLDSNYDTQSYEKAFLCMCSFEKMHKDYEKMCLYKASLLQEILSINLTNARLYDDYLKARRDSEKDPLTEVGNRRVLEQVLEYEYQRALRYQRTVSVAIVDVDNFKQINDTAGHSAGDLILRKIARLMRKNIRTSDMVIVRYGGDEFVIIMPETKKDQSAVLLERLRLQINEITIQNIPEISISCGIAEFNGNSKGSPEDILDQADEALYQAKRAGRNRVVTYRPEPLYL